MSDPERNIDEAIAVGSVVALKSGGPAMTVVSIAGELATCQWFDGATPHERAFKLAALAPKEAVDENLLDKMSEAARGFFDDLKKRAKGPGQ